MDGQGLGNVPHPTMGHIPQFLLDPSKPSPNVYSATLQGSRLLSRWQNKRVDGKRAPIYSLIHFASPSNELPTKAKSRNDLLVPRVVFAT